jgi:hypothetical protein
MLRPRTASMMQPTTSAVVLSNIAGVFTMAMWIYVAEKIWA